MFFDNLAGIVERHLPQHIPVLKEARIFRMEPWKSETSISEAIEAWEPDERVIENFHLPFKTIALEEASVREGAGNTCTVLSVRNEAERTFSFLIGHGCRTDTIVASGVIKALPDCSELIDPLAKSYGGVARITDLSVLEGTKKTGLRTIASNIAWITPGLDRVDVLEKGNATERAMAKMAKDEPGWKEELALAVKSGEAQGQIAKVTTNIVHMRCCVAVLETIIINEPARFVVEERPLLPPRDSKTAIRRSFDRPHFVVLKPRQIRERFILPTKPESIDDEERRRVSPHERRGHLRRLQAERFKNARGQTIWIKPMWIGPSEAIHGNKKYKVRLDL